MANCQRNDLFKQGQQKIMRQLLGKTGSAFTIIAPFWCDYGYNIEIGENFFSNHNLVILDGAKVLRSSPHFYSVKSV